MKVTFNDLLKYEPEKVVYDIDYRMFSCWHFLDEDLRWNYNNEKLISEGRVKTSYIKSFCFDGRREWILGYLSFDEKPIMFFYAYGRDGCDGYNNTIVNQFEYDNFSKYLKSLSQDDNTVSEQNTNTLTDDATWMTSFYDQSLFDEFKTWR